VIVEGYHEETDLLMVGRHQGQAPEIDTQILINDGRNVTAFGERYLVEVTAVAGIDLVGTAIKKITATI
jgi:ribosomal protein S12 methylthiotransferase